MRKCSAVLTAFTALVLPFTVISSAAAQDTAPPASSAPAGSGYRPTPLGVGIGLGYVVNGDIDLMKPTAASVRIVLTDRIMLEPLLILSYQSSSNEVGMASTDTSTTALGFGTQLRYQLASRGPLDFSGIGSLFFTHTSGSNSVADVHTSAQNLDLRWGFGISWWFYSTWSMSLDASNTFISWNHNSNDMGAGPDQSQSTFLFGLIYNPQVMLLTHLFF